MRKKIVLISTAALMSLGIFGETVFAESATELESNQQQVRNERSQVQSTLTDAEKEISDVLYDLKGLSEKIVNTEKAIQENESQLTAVKKSIKDSEKQVTELKKEIKDLETQIDRRFEILRDRLVAYQQSGGDIAFLDVLAGSQNFSEFVSRAKAVSNISKSDIKLMEQLERDQKKVEAKKQAVHDQLSAQKDSKAELEGVLVTIKDQKRQQDKNREKLENKQAELNEKKTKLELKDSDLASLEEKIGADIQLKQEEAAAKAKAEAEAEAEEAARAAAEQAEDEQRDKLVKEPQPSVAKDQPAVSVKKESAPSSHKAEVKSPVSSHVSKPERTESSNHSAKPTVEVSKPEPTQVGGLQAAINAGYSVIGTPYVWGGKKPGGFDCSGFVSWAYGQAGISVPSSTSALQSVGSKVSYSDAKPGDMVFFNTYKTNGHVGIYLGGRKFIGAQDSGLDVANMNSGYWKDHFTGHVRRIK